MCPSFNTSFSPIPPYSPAMDAMFMLPRHPSQALDCVASTATTILDIDVQNTYQLLELEIQAIPKLKKIMAKKRYNVM